MIKLFKVSFHFNQVFKHREGRFLTVYRKGNAINGKIVSTNLLWATLQLPDGTKRLRRIPNFKVQCVAADRVIMSINANTERV